MPVEEGAVHGRGAGDGGHADLGAVGGRAVDRGDDALRRRAESARRPSASALVRVLAVVMRCVPGRMRAGSGGCGACRA